MIVIQVQIQALLAAIEREGIIRGPNIESNIEVAKLLVFSREVEKMEKFIMTCKLYLRMKIEGTVVKEQI